MDNRSTDRQSKVLSRRDARKLVAHQRVEEYMKNQNNNENNQDLSRILNNHYNPLERGAAAIQDVGSKLLDGAKAAGGAIKNVASSINRDGLSKHDNYTLLVEIKRAQTPPTPTLN